MWAATFDQDWSFVGIELESLFHPHALVESQRSGVVRGDAELGLLESRGGEPDERLPQEGGPEPSVLLVGMDGEDVYIPDRLVLPAARKKEADGVLAELSNAAELRGEVVRAEVLFAEFLQGHGLVVGSGSEADGVQRVRGHGVAVDVKRS